MATYRLDISFPLIKLSQYSTTPVKIHCSAIQGLYDYTRKAIYNVIYYWRDTPHLDLPLGPIPTPKDGTNYIPTTRNQDSCITTRAIVYFKYTNTTTQWMIIAV